MAIYQRDRRFGKILEKIEINTVPLKFIRTLKCVFQNGETILIDKSDLTEVDVATKDVNALIKEHPLYENIEDLEVKINHVEVERFVVDSVEAIFLNALES